MKRYIKSDFGKNAASRGYLKVTTRDWTHSPKQLIKYINATWSTINGRNPKATPSDAKHNIEDIKRRVSISREEADMLRDRLNLYIDALDLFKHSGSTPADVAQLKTNIINSGI